MNSVGDEILAMRVNKRYLESICQRVMFTEAGRADREQVRRNLEQYCGLDTFGMVEIVRVLRRLV